MKMLLLLICFISTSVFASEPKERGAVIKDATGKNSNNFSRGLHNNGVKNTKTRKNNTSLKNDSVKSKNNKADDGYYARCDNQCASKDKEPSMHQGAMNSVRPKKPGSKKPGSKNPTTSNYCTGYC